MVPSSKKKKREKERKKKRETRYRFVEFLRRRFKRKKLNDIDQQEEREEIKLSLISNIFRDKSIKSIACFSLN